MEFMDANGIIYMPSRWLTFDDVLLMPKSSMAESRNDPKINLSTRITSNMGIHIPIISSPMDTVTEAKMAIAMATKGGMGILHRFYGDARREAYFEDVKQVIEKTGNIAFSIGLSPEDLNLVEQILSYCNRPPIVCIDVAHGHLRKNIEQVARVSKKFGNNIQIIAGNVATPVGVADLVKAGANGIRISVGSGSNCTTRRITGCGIPSLTCIMQARRTINALQSNTTLIMDGGIRNSGDIVKALAAGADCVMLGSLLAGTDETPGPTYYYEEIKKEYKEVFPNDTFYSTQFYKKYRGQASRDFMTDYGKNGVAAEGVSRYVSCKGSVFEVIDELIGGIKSGLTYSGVFNLEDLNEKATFIEITNAGYQEGLPHGLLNQIN